MTAWLQSYYNKPSDQELDELADLLDGIPSAMNIEMIKNQEMGQV